MPQQNPFDQFDAAAQPVPVEQIKPIISDPTKASQEARAERTESRQEQGSNWRVLTPEEADAQGLPKGGTYQINQLGEVRTIQKAPAGGGSEQQAQSAAQLLLKSAGVEGDKDPVADLIKQSTSGGLESAAANTYGFVTGEATTGMENIARLRTLVSDMTLAFTEGKLGAGVSNADVIFLKERVGNLADPTIPANERLAAWDEVKTRLQRFAGEETPSRSPLDPTGEARTPDVTGEGEVYMTPQDVEMQSRLNEAYQAGASLGDLQAIAAEYNRSFPIGTQADLDAARSQGRAINVNPSGRRTEAEQFLGGVAESEIAGVPVGEITSAYAAGATNALLSGGMDELGGLLGLDADRIQAAKEALREKQGAASLAGEITGAAGQLALGGLAGGGAKAIAAREIAQGAAYGAGESNENRALGALAGAGGAVAGQQIAKRLVEPAAQAVIQRIARANGVAPEVVEQAAKEALQEVDAPPVTAAEAEGIGAVARKAVSRAPGATTAKRQLAEMAKVNPEAQAAAERLGIELPVDVVSDGAQLKQLSGMARSQVGSEAETAWMRTVDDSVRKLDDTFREIDATTDIALVSDDVFARMNRTMQEAEEQAASLRREVDNAVDVRAPVNATNLQRELAATINDLGGLQSAKQAMSAEEKKLLAALGERATAKQPTYAYLNRVRDDIGKALQKGQGPWTDTNEATLKRYYAALADDRVEHVARVAGEETADKLRASNTLFKEMYDRREDMVDLFGKDLSRGISGLLSRAITQGGKGEAQALNQALSKIPPEMHGRVLTSALLAQAQTRSARGGFSFSNFAKAYQDLRKQSPIYAKLAKAIGPEREAVLRDIYSISKRMADADSRILRTGKANQAMLGALQAESLMARVAKGALPRIAATTGGAVAGGPAGAAGAMAVTELIEKAGTSRVNKVHRLLSSERFKELIDKVAEGKVTTADINRVANSGPFMKFSGIDTADGRRRWIESALAVSATPETDTIEQSTIEVR